MGYIVFAIIFFGLWAITATVFKFRKVDNKKIENIFRLN